MKGPTAAFTACCILAATLVVASALVQGMPDPDDYRIYAHKYAAALWHHGEAPNAYRPPFYPLVLSPIVQFTASPNAWMIVLHAGLTISILIGVRRIVRRNWGESFAVRAACVLIAVDPILVFQSGQIMTETIFTAFVLWTLLPWLDEKPKSWIEALSNGLLAGLGFLTRPTMAPIFIAVGIALALQRRLGDFRKWMLAVVIAVVVILPWAIRNKMVLGEAIFSTTHGGYTLWLGNNPSFYGEEVIGGRNWAATDAFEAWQLQNQLATSGLAEVAKDRWFRASAVEWIRENPSDAAKTAFYRLRSFWGMRARSGPTALRPLIGVFNAMLFLLALYGWFLCKGWRGPWLAATLAVLAVSLVHTVYWSNMRFRAPIEPLLAIWAAMSLESFWRLRGPAT